MKRLFTILNIFCLTLSLYGPSSAIEAKKPSKDSSKVSSDEERKAPAITYYADSKESLRGLKGLGILIESINPDLELPGISKERMKSEIQIKLREAGIPILNAEERIREPGKPYLYINLNIYNWREEVIYGYSLKVDLSQLVILDRQRKTGCFGTTWVTGSSGIVGANKVEQVIKTELAEALNKFIKDFREVNPR